MKKLWQRAKGTATPKSAPPKIGSGEESSLRAAALGAGAVLFPESSTHGEAQSTLDDGFRHDTVKLTVVSSENLPKMGLLSGPCDAFCVVNWCGQEFRTGTQKATFSPVWSESHYFNLDPKNAPGAYLQDPAVFDSAGGSLRLKVLDKGLRDKLRGGEGGSLVGEAVMPGTEMSRIVRSLGAEGKHETELRIIVSKKGQDVKGHNNELCVLQLKVEVRNDTTSIDHRL